MSLSSFVAGLIAISSFLLFFMTRLFGTVTRAVDISTITVTTDNDLMLATNTIVNTTWMTHWNSSGRELEIKRYKWDTDIACARARWDCGTGLDGKSLTGTTIVLWPSGYFIITLITKMTFLSRFSSESRQVFILPVNITSHARSSHGWNWKKGLLGWKKTQPAFLLVLNWINETWAMWGDDDGQDEKGNSGKKYQSDG